MVGEQALPVSFLPLELLLNINVVQNIRYTLFIYKYGSFFDFFFCCYTVHDSLCSGDISIDECSKAEIGI